MSTIGIEMELSWKGESVEYAKKALKNHRNIIPQIHNDCGCIETTTTVLTEKILDKRTKDYKDFKKAMDIIKANTETSVFGGTHIHIGVENDEWTIKRACWIASMFYEELQKVFGRKQDSFMQAILTPKGMKLIRRDQGIRAWAKNPYYDMMSRKMNNEYYRTNKIDPTLKYGKEEFMKDMDEVIEGAEEEGSKQYWIVTPNMPGEDLTVEFRGPKGSNDIEEILEWVKVCLNITELAKNEDISRIAMEDILRKTKFEESKEREKIGIDQWEYSNRRLAVKEAMHNVCMDN